MAVTVAGAGSRDLLTSAGQNGRRMQRRDARQAVEVAPSAAPQHWCRAGTRSPVEFTTIERVERDHRRRGQGRNHAVELRDSLMRRGCRRMRQKDYLGFACRKIVGKVEVDPDLRTKRSCF